MPLRWTRHILLTSALFIGFGALGAASAHAQAVVGDTIRFHYGGLTPHGELLAIGADTVIIRGQGGDARYARGMMTELEVRRGSRRAGLSDVGKGTAIGLGVGSALALWAISSAHGGEERQVLPVAVFGAVSLGSLSGMLIGTATSFRHVDRWEPAALAPPTSGAAPDSSTRTARVAATREVSPGDTVRFEIGAERVRHALLVAAARDTLLVQPIGGARTLAVPAAAMVDAEVLRGRRRMGARAVAIGALVGAGVGMIYGFRPHTGGGIASKHPIDAIPILGGLALGAAVGVASAGTSEPNWRPFDATRAAAP